MSTGESKQTQTVEDLKSELRSAVRHLSDLSATDVSFDEFCQILLSKLVSLAGAHGALLWQVTPSGGVQPTHQSVSPHLVLDIDPARHRECVASVVCDTKPLCIESETFAPSESEINPEAHCWLMLAPVFNRQHKGCGVLELLQRKNINATAQDGYLKFLERMAELLQRWHEHHDRQRLSSNTENQSTTLDFLTEIHRSIDYTETAYAIANESRRLLNCDRVSMARWNGNSCRIAAISSQDRFDNRANVVRKLAALATACVSSDTRLWITGVTEGLAPEMVRRINDYLDESHCRTLIVLPLCQQPPGNAALEFQPKRRQKPRKLGALIIEYFDVDVAEEMVHQPIQLIQQHAQIATANALEHQQIFLRPVWKRLGELTSFLFRDHFAKSMTALAAVTMFALYLIFFPAELKMRVSGVMQPAERRNIFAQTDGIVHKVHVDQGQQVAADELLVELINPDLDIAIEEARGQLSVVQQKIYEVNSRLSRASQLPQDERIALWGQRDQLLDQQSNLESRLALMDRKMSLQTITSPIAGTVVTWDAKNRLTDLPISTRQFILSVANFDGAWQAELRIPQNQVGYVVAAVQQNNNQPLDVEFRVGTNPNILVFGKLVRLADRTDPGQSGVPEFRAIVDADVSVFDELRPGAGLTAKIHCGRRSQGFVWFYQVIDFLRMRVFF